MSIYYSVSQYPPHLQYFIQSSRNGLTRVLRKWLCLWLYSAGHPLPMESGIFSPHIRQVSHLQEMVVYLPLVRLHICKKWFLLFIGWMSSLQEMVLPLISHASSLVEVFFPFQFRGHQIYRQWCLVLPHMGEARCKATNAFSLLDALCKAHS